MEPNANKILQQAVIAHQQGRLEEAEHLYLTVLEEHPSHADVSHNLGVLKVAVNDMEVALSLFKTALDSNPKVEQFWLSYIDALIKQNQIKNAKRLLKKARKKGFSGEKLGALEAQLKQSSQTSNPPSLKQNKNADHLFQARLNSLLTLFQAGQHAKAEKLALSITQNFPHHSFAWKVLGAIFKQTDQLLKALTASQTVVSIEPQDAEAHNNLAVILQELGRSKEAETSYKKAIALNPQYASAHNNLGVILQDLHRFEDAQASFNQAIASQPNHIDAHYNLGVTLQELNLFTEAEASLKQAIHLRPDFAEAHKSLGDVLQVLNRSTEAEERFKKAIAIEPDFTDAFINLGLTLRELGRLVEAEANHTRAVVLEPDYAEAHNNLGNTLKELGKLEEAAASLGRAVALKPDYAEVHNNLGIILNQLGRLEEAEASYNEAIVWKPDYAVAYGNLGKTLQELGRLDEAEVSYGQAIGLKTDDATVYNNLATMQQNQGRLEEALASYSEAIELKVDYSQAYSNKNLCLNYSSNWSSLFIYQQHLEFEKQFGGLKIRVPLMAKIKKYSGDRIRIGYVSGDFRTHSVAHFFEPLLQHHNANVVENFCYYNNKIVDDVTNRLMALAEHWRPIVDISHANVVDLIIADKIDILVDLSGHTADNRLLVFAQKPAPILVTWLGSSNTTGLSAIDYRFTDVIADPIGEADSFNSETLFRLPNGFHCYRGNESALLNLELPHKNRGHITFGSFNNMSKLTPEVIKVWSKILNAVPQSQLLLKTSQVTNNLSHYAQLFKQEGISEHRIEYYGYLPSDHEHLELYGAIDIGLDPFPYNGVTTTCEALWMGVPVITLAGDRHAGRVGASILTNVGLTDFIAQDIDGYIQLAAEMAANPNYLQEIRRGLRKRMLDSPLCDGSSFANDIEKAYQEMWQTSLN
jgi:protein O-GlcNAc transferase